MPPQISAGSVTDAEFLDQRGTSYTWDANATKIAGRHQLKAGLEYRINQSLEGVGMEQNKWHAYDVWKHGMECLDACVGGPILRIAAMLHDVGKVTVPDTILCKPGALTAEEFEVIMGHSAAGAELVSRVEGLERVGAAALID